LRSVGVSTWESTAGLRYELGSAQGNRVLHVLEHAVDNPLRAGEHGVFDAGRKGALSLVDEGYLEVLEGGANVITEQQGIRTVYHVDMGRPVGYVGGQAGASMGYPVASRIRIVLEGRNVITAFPER